MTAEELLEQLAAVWVQRWLAHGGGLIVDRDCNDIQISMRLDGWRRKVDADAPAWFRRDRISHDMWNVGRWRELSELCGVVPGLRAAIIDHVALHGETKPWGAVHMVSTSVPA